MSRKINKSSNMDPVKRLIVVNKENERTNKVVMFLKLTIK